MPAAKDIEKRIAITGASSGIGRALAEELAAPGISLFLTARREPFLQETASACLARGAEVRTDTFDVTDSAAIENWIESIEGEGPVDVLVLNAGLFSGTTLDGQLESVESARSLMEANLLSPVTASLLMARKMLGRRQGHIILISSLAAKAPQADAPVYSGSKAGLTGFGRAMREFLMEHGVKITIVHPGHVLTYQAEQQHGRLPFMTTPQSAAKIIASAIQSGRGEIDFPLLPKLLVSVLGLLPWRLQAFFNRPYRFKVGHPGEEYQERKSKEGSDKT